MHTTIPQKVGGVIVTYNPDLDALRILIAAVAPQLDELVIVDNGSREDVTQALSDQPSHRVIPLGDNYGIATAQNRGIEYGRGNGWTHALLLDQDSVPAPDMVGILLAAAEAKQREGARLACVGPRYTDSRHGDISPFVRLEGLRLIRQPCTGDDAIVDVDFLIASGCLIPMQAIDAIGAMRDELFIDYVDIEWGLRAQMKGYRSFGVCAATMTHALGDKSVAFGGRQVPVHSPLRHYYHFRNAIWLCRQSWITRQWKLVLVWRLLRQFLFFSLVTPPRLQHSGMMVLGTIHGIMNRMGKR
jgi:rhamnosyltransferase